MGRAWEDAGDYVRRGTRDVIRLEPKNSKKEERDSEEGAARLRRRRAFLVDRLKREACWPDPQATVFKYYSTTVATE